MSSKQAGRALLIAVTLHALLLWALLRPPTRPSIAPVPPPMSLALVGPPTALAVPASPKPPVTPPALPQSAPPSPVQPSTPRPPEPPEWTTPVPTPVPPPPPQLPSLAPVDPGAEPESLHPTTPVFMPAPASSVAVADCGLGQVVQRALRADTAVQAALSGIPARAMTPARALMLWNAGWIAVQDGRGGESIAPIRQTIVRLARAAPAGCVTAEVRGPEFLILPSPGGTVVMVIGSASWRWSDLIETDTATSETR